MNLTEHQIEIAARKLCELRGWNPDGIVDSLNGVVFRPRRTSLDIAEAEILTIYQGQQTIAHALAQPAQAEPQEPT